MEIRPIILKPEEQERLQELEQILAKYKIVLSLKNENIEVGISAKSNAFLHWYEERKVWGIYILPTDNDFTPIHELGHIFLAKKTNYPYFARSRIKSNKIFEGLHGIVNHMIDCFVDYNLIQFEGLYGLYIDDAHLWKSAKQKGKIKGEVIDLFHSYKALIGYYLSLKLIDNEKDKDYCIRVKNYLRNAKQLIQKTFPCVPFNFQSIELKLDRFNEIKNTKDPNTIVDFISSILRVTSLWKESDIQEQTNILYPKPSSV